MNNVLDDVYEINKAFTENYTDDLDFYLEFCTDHTTLELFAGYGRVTNFLCQHDVDIESVELLNEYSKYIKLPTNRVHTCNVLDFKPLRTFDRVIAAYNSLCLLTKDKDIIAFFKNLDSWLNSGGMAVFSYYHPDYWHEAAIDAFQYKGSNITYLPSFDLTARNQKKAKWTDVFKTDNEQLLLEHDIRVYENAADLAPYLRSTDLDIIDVVENYNKDKSELVEPGWVDFVLKKK
ncbi:hypothetical protein H0A36_26835 [Endozoicomonas sp. SM1973]|uniref:Methyltransferase domain-containing protein n=1 Tax=Spartinivicinus marinus TaxID=2994442 RepID=A0A853IKN1_9GAMM|nr:hypothetical protein [Spartinivicinus marinus]MCX4030434.1 hypothetical protein [Spartinivicinus marinus]NYZ69635.1 hypothetical protein [Spartinivicinus marinus]